MADGTLEDALTAPGPAASAPNSSVQPPVATPGPSSGQGPHAGLINFIQSSLVGLGAFARSAATGGREGGIADVQAYQANQQAMELRAQEAKRQADAAQQQKEDHELRMKMGTADLNMKTALLSQLISEAPLKRQQLFNEVQNGMLDVLAKKGVPMSKQIEMLDGASTGDHVQAVSTAADGNLTDNHFIPTYGADGAGKPGGKTAVVPNLSTQDIHYSSSDLAPVLTSMQNVIDNAKKELGDPNNAQLKNAQAQLDFVKQGLAQGGTVSHHDFMRLKESIGVNVEQQIQQKEHLTEAQTKQASLKEVQQKADPLFKLENDPNEMAGEKSTAAVAMLQNKLSSETDPQQKVRISKLLGQAREAHAGFISDKIQQANAEQAAKQGDPVAAGKALADGTLTLADLKTRGVTPKFILDVTNAAKRFKPDYNPADENIAEQVAKSPQASQFFGSANSLTSKGGTLDQVVDQGKNLPDLKLPLFNKAADVISYASGHKEVQAYLMTALGAADDYAKVVGGGQPSEHMQMLIFNKLTAANNQGTRKAVTDAMRGSVNSQVESRIGKNQFLNRLYGYTLPQNQKGGGTADTSAFDPKKDVHPMPQ